jgi:uncharacterized membrane protein YkoI
MKTDNNNREDIMKKTITFLTTTTIILAFVVLSYGEESSRGITLTDAIKIATEKIGGEVVKAELEKGFYEIKVRTSEGKIKKIYLDEHTGEPVEKIAVTLDEATAIATNEVSGDVVKVEFERGRYEIKIRTAEGIIKEVYVDARSGKIVKIKEKKKFLK